jgi:hypothetical protein
MSPITSTLANGSAYGYRTFAAAAAGSFESIATSTPTSGTSVTFSSIPSTYASLQIRAYVQAGDGSGRVRLNGSSSTSDYAAHILRGDGANVIASGAGTGSYDGVPYYNYYSSASGAVIIVDIHDYASTTKNKTVRLANGIDINGGGYMALWTGLYLSTTAVSSITITAGGGFTTGTTISLYGIKGA